MVVKHIDMLYYCVIFMFWFFASNIQYSSFANIVNDNRLKKEKLNIIGYFNGSYVVDNKFSNKDFLVIFIYFVLVINNPTP